MFLILSPDDMSMSPGHTLHTQCVISSPLYKTAHNIQTKACFTNIKNKIHSTFVYPFFLYSKKSITPAFEHTYKSNSKLTLKK